MLQYFSINRFSIKLIISVKGMVIITWAFSSSPNRHFSLLDRKYTKMAVIF